MEQSEFIDDAGTSENGEIVSANEAEPKGPERPVRPGGAVSFVVIFLMVTFVLLSLGRYAVNTGPMNWYLFQVANTTAWVLGLIGDASSVEDPAMYRNRTHEVRAALEAWKTGTTPSRAKDPNSPEAPLTSWETWQYRSMLLGRQLEQTKALIDLATPKVRNTAKNDTEWLGILQEELDRLTASTRMDGPSGPMPVMAPQLAPILKSSEEILEALQKGGRPEGVPLSEVLDQLAAQIESGFALQRPFLQERATQLSVQVHDRHGPTVLFVARKGLLTRLNEAQAELSSVKENMQVPAAERNARIDTIQSRIDSLTARRESVTDPEKRAELERDVIFRFNLVPDCGALPSMSIFLAAMIAFPTRYWKRLAGLAIGLPLLYVINIARLSCLAVIGAYSGNGELFKFAHEYVWQAVYIIFVVIVWLLWVELLVRPRETWRRKIA